MEELLRNKI